MDFEYVVHEKEVPQMTSPADTYGYRLKPMLWTAQTAKDFLSFPDKSLRVQYVKLIFPCDRPWRRDVKAMNKMLKESLELFKRYYRECHNEGIEFAWVRVPISNQYHVALFYHDTQLDCSADKAGALDVILLDNLYGYDYRVTHICDPIVDDYSSCLISPAEDAYREAVKFLDTMLAYKVPYACCSWEKGAHQFIYRFSYNAELPKFCGFSSKQKIAMRHGYAKFCVFDY